MGPALRGCQSQATRTEPAHQLAALDHLRTECDQVAPVLLGDVVVIALESSPGYVGEISERVELFVRHVTHEVTPLAAPPPPSCLVDQDRHETSALQFNRTLLRAVSA